MHHHLQLCHALNPSPSGHTTFFPRGANWQPVGWAHTEDMLWPSQYFLNWLPIFKMGDFTLKWKLKVSLKNGNFQQFRPVFPNGYCHLELSRAGPFRWDVLSQSCLLSLIYIACLASVGHEFVTPYSVLLYYCYLIRHLKVNEDSEGHCSLFHFNSVINKNYFNCFASQLLGLFSFHKS